MLTLIAYWGFMFFGFGRGMNYGRPPDYVDVDLRADDGS
jgi:hypothetical protein